jgi:hypothetical protein
MHSGAGVHSRARVDQSPLEALGRLGRGELIHQITELQRVRRAVCHVMLDQPGHVVPSVPAAAPRAGVQDVELPVRSTDAVLLGFFTHRKSR